MRYLPLAACALLGVLLDFLVYGVAEVEWPVVYLPLFFAALSIFYSWLLRSRWEKKAKVAVLTMLAGIAGARLTLSHWRRQATYSMTAQTGTTITLRAPGSSRMLLVSSAALQAALAHKPAGETIPVVINVTTDYGCIHEFEVASIDGIDLNQDSAASWTWRTEGAAPATGVGLEDHALPWCRFRWYRRS